MEHMMRASLKDESGLILRYIITIVVTIGLIAFLITQFGPLAWERLSVRHQAEEIAESVAGTVRMTGSLDDGLDQGREQARIMGYTGEDRDNVKFIWLPEDQVQKTDVRIEITKQVDTWLVRLIKPLQNVAKIQASSEASFGEIK